MPAEPVLPHTSLSAVANAAAAINATLDLNAVLTTIAEQARNVTRGEASSMLLLDKRRKKLLIAAATGARGRLLVGQEFDSCLGIAGQVVRTEKPIVTANVKDSPHFASQHEDLGSFKARSLIATPMVRGGELVGVLEVVNRRDEQTFDDGDLQVLRVFATLATLAAHNAKTHDDLKRRLQGLTEATTSTGQIIGNSPAIKESLALCDRVARSTATVLLVGESGTGKELCAKYIHRRSPRRDEPFIAINCAAMTETLLESELFGHEKGAFTSAHAQRQGWFELADGGTLFLDEIGEISRSTQAKLLRVLQEKEFIRVGGTKTISSDVRIVAATNRNLKNMMADGLFREDLYYRLSVFPVQLPALRERREDIPLLVDHFVRRAVINFHSHPVQVGEQTMAEFMAYDWPGNIRELQNIVERAVLMADGPKLLPVHLPSDIKTASNGDADGTYESTVRNYERAVIIKALNDNGWNQSKSARALGINRDNLRYRIKRYNITRPEEKVLG